MMNDHKLMGKWKEIKGEIITQWGKMTDDEVEQTTGNLISITGLIQQKYGEKKEEIQEKLSSIVAKFSDETEAVKQKLKD